MRRPIRFWLLSVLIAFCACSLVAYSTIPHPYTPNTNPLTTVSRRPGTARLLASTHIYLAHSARDQEDVGEENVTGCVVGQCHVAGGRVK